MRVILLALALTSACGKKPAPQAPANAAAPAEPAPASPKSNDSPADEEKKSESKSMSDPCDGGQ